jgi:AcrR family transcriptional regulator
MQARDRILGISEKLFLKHGARRITMDDIALDAGISKKTLYQHFDDKHALIFQVTKGLLLRIEAQIDYCSKHSNNALDEMIQLMECTSEVFRNINPIMLFDLHDHFPRSWKLYQKHKKTYLQMSVASNIKRGIREKLYRSDIDPDIVAMIRLAQMDSLFNAEMMPIKKNDFLRLREQTTMMFLHGLLSDQGRDMLRSYKRIKLNE